MKSGPNGTTMTMMTSMKMKERRRLDSRKSLHNRRVAQMIMITMGRMRVISRNGRNIGINAEKEVYNSHLSLRRSSRKIRDKMIHFSSLVRDLSKVSLI
jgi:hypothetical protein